MNDLNWKPKLNFKGFFQPLTGEIKLIVELKFKLSIDLVTTSDFLF